MAITIDVNSATTPAELKTTLESANFASQANTQVTTMEGSMQSLTSEGQSNCDLFGTIGSMIGDAADAFKSGMNTLIQGVSDAYKAVMEKVGEAIKTVKAMIQPAVDAVNAMITKLTTMAQEGLAAVKTALSELFSGINSAVSGITSAVSSAVAALKDVASKLFASIKSLIGRSCPKTKEALANVGTGAGVDSAVNAATATAANFAQSNMTNVQSSLQSASTAVGGASTSMDATKTTANGLSSKAAAVAALA